MMGTSKSSELDDEKEGGLASALMSPFADVPMLVGVCDADGPALSGKAVTGVFARKEGEDVGTDCVTGAAPAWWMSGIDDEGEAPTFESAITQSPFGSKRKLSQFRNKNFTFRKRPRISTSSTIIHPRMLL